MVHSEVEHVASPAAVVVDTLGSLETPVVPRCRVWHLPSFTIVCHGDFTKGNASSAAIKATNY